MPIPQPIDPTADALFLDFDGTLVRFVDDPQAVAIDRHALDTLLMLKEQLSGALAIVSGRRIADLDRFLTPLSFAAAGVHGLETRSAPGAPVESSAGPRTLDGVRASLEKAVAAQPALKLEDKGTALVLHYRERPDLEAEARAIMAAAVAGRGDLSVMHGNRIVEVHPAGMDKGNAVRRLMEAAPFAGRRPVYVGDDTTDEFAMRVVAEMGGLAVKVGDGETAANARLDDVGAVHRWLAGALPLSSPASVADNSMKSASHD
ncbi:trehalose-phosphatase [Aureimonas mangrovi]|uniref:trehalose-phosphatase n=1 Tax=Aureimonas mangrovi TaxID=2758041 RepID=UPI001FEBD7E2|nr:trehalose-phosphatase [Aureimonas mangrovi]